MKTITAALALALLVGCGKAPAPESPPMSASPAVPRQTPPPVESIWMPGCTNAIVPPITFTFWDTFSDGGTLAFRFRDSHTNDFSFCCDGRIRSGTSTLIYFGADHPSRPGARMLPEGSKFEADLFSLIKAWVKEQESAYADSSLDPYMWDNHHPFAVATRLKDIFRRRANIQKARDWLNQNYSTDEQQSLLLRGTPDGLSEQDRTAWHKIQSLHGYKNDRRQDKWSPTNASTATNQSALRTD